MESLVEDIQDSARWVANALNHSGYRADFSLESLKEIDRFFDDHSHRGAPTPTGLLAEHLGPKLFALGGYIGEVIRRNLAGQWRADDNDPQGEVNIALQLSDGALIWPVQRVMKRLKNGAVDGLYAYGVAVGLTKKAQ